MNSNHFRKPLFSNNQMLTTAGLIILAIACFINQANRKPTLVISKQDSAINFNNTFLTFMSAGNKRLVTDLLWIETLIESDLEHYKKNDLNNWMYLRFDAISVLDPLFYENYLYGGQFLSIVKDDLQGASLIYEKGLLHYPDDYSLNYSAGFNYYFELGNSKRGVELLEKVKYHPKAPTFLPSIVNKLKLEVTNDLSLVYELVNHHYQSTADEQLKKRMMKELYAIKSEIDLKCLNGVNKDCDRLDYLGNKYIYKDGAFHTLLPFVRYRIKKKEDRVPSKSINTLK
jgi:hypothetical protein